MCFPMRNHLLPCTYDRVNSIIHILSIHTSLSHEQHHMLFVQTPCVLNAIFRHFPAPPLQCNTRHIFLINVLGILGTKEPTSFIYHFIKYQARSQMSPYFSCPIAAVGIHLGDHTILIKCIIFYQNMPGMF